MLRILKKRVSNDTITATMFVDKSTLEVTEGKRLKFFGTLELNSRKWFSKWILEWEAEGMWMKGRPKGRRLEECGKTDYC